MITSDTIDNIVDGNYADISSICDKLREGNKRVQSKIKNQQHRAQLRKEKAEAAEKAARAFVLDEDYITQILNDNIHKASVPIKDQVLLENCFSQETFEREMNNGLKQLASLYITDVPINRRNTANLGYEFLSQKIDDGLTNFMTNLLFGDAMNNVAKMQAQYAENALGRCLGNEGEKVEDEKIENEEPKSPKRAKKTHSAKKRVRSEK